MEHRHKRLKSIERAVDCIYFKKSLPLIKQNDLTNLKKCLVTVFNVNIKKWFFTCVYMSRSLNLATVE